jgi:diguanylate cyclase (GGDEF)-like protein
VGRFDETIQGEKTMTLFKQIALIVSVIFILLFLIVLGVAFNVIKESSKKSLYESAQNSATSITLTVDNVGSDLGSIKTILNAAYDNGNYERIVFIDVNGKVQYSRMKKYDEISVPKWFVDFVSLEPIIAKANLSSGWAVLGVLSVYGDLETVYVQLYEIFLQLCLYLAAAYMTALWVLYYVFKGLLNPLHRVKEQADAIINNEFIINQNMSYTSEFNSVINSMNAMVVKVEQIFNNANEALKQNKELLYFDGVTKLYNRRYFALKLNEYICQNSILSSGTIVAVNIERADILNKSIGYKNTDAFFIEIAQLAKRYFENGSESFVARLNGTEFIAIIPHKDSCELRNTIGVFSVELENAFKSLECPDAKVVLNVGYCDYYEEKNIGEVFAKIDNTLAQAKLAQSCEVVCLRENELSKIGKESWRQTFQNALENDGFVFDYDAIYNAKTKKPTYETIRMSLDAQGKQYSYAQFIAPLVELQMLGSFYIYVLTKMLKNTRESVQTVQLPTKFVTDGGNLKQLKILLSQHQKAQPIVFEISEDAFINDFEQTKAFIQMLKEYGYAFAINNFIANIDDYGFLKVLKPKYIKADKSFILDNEQNLNLINIIMESIGIEIVVSGIEDEDQIGYLIQKGIGSYTLKT